MERTLFDRLEHHARHDPLTGLANRRALDAAQGRVVEACRNGTAGPSMLVFLDLDRFKQVNDEAGHVFGDRMLVAIAGEMRSGLRSDDLLVRVGGDEFALLLRDCAPNDAEIVTRKLTDRVEALSLEHQGREYSVGISFGMAKVDGSRDPVDVMAEADAACYRANAARRVCL